VELAGKNLLIIGKGVLGEAVANIAAAFGMNVVFAASLLTGEHDLARPEMMSALPESDFVSLHCPLATQTQQLVNKEFLSAMKGSAFLINTARGGLIDEPALADALKKQYIAGAALDGLSVEPPPKDHVLLNKNIPNLIITPHNAWVSVECRQRLLDGVVANIEQWQNGKPINVVTA
jgi:glycerate dehydrogenase